MLRGFLLAALAAWLTGPASGDVLHVPSDFPTIQAAIDAAADGDEVVAADGTYTGPGNRDLDFGGRLITLRSENGPESCVIDCQDAGRGFLFINGETSAAVVDGFTIHDGRVNQLSPFGAKGAGMYIISSSPTVRDCAFSSNCACPDDELADAFGGAIYTSGGSPMIDSCTFSLNKAGGILADHGYGGGIYATGGATTVAGCEFLSNGASGRCQGLGGAIYRGGNEIVTDCVFSSNGVASGACGGGATAAGGAVYSAQNLPAWFINCMFTDNHVNGSGAGGSAGGAMAGGLVGPGGNETVINCAFIGNTASGPGPTGGAMRGYQTVINCAFIGNGAWVAAGLGGTGGAVYAFTGGTYVNCTFSGNSCGNNGGGAYTGSTTTLANCILWGDSPNELAGAATVTYSDVQGGWPGIGNINADPMFVDPDDGDYRLSPGSPCIDAGNNAAVQEDTDLDGNPRLLDVPETPDTGNGVAPIVDMGAYESLGGGCLALTSQDIVCHADGSTFTLNVEGLSACTGGTVMATFTGSGGAVGEALCFSVMVNSEQGGFCCSTQICIQVPDCSLDGDLDGDGIVGAADLLLLLGQWGLCPTNCYADLDGDSVVGVTDLLFLLANWSP